MLVEAIRYLSSDWLTRYYQHPIFHFSYYGFSWVRPLPGSGMYWLFAGLGALSILIMLGLFYRIAIILFFLAFSYVFLIDQSYYLNHFYLIMIMALLLCAVPANRCISLDRKIFPKITANTIPLWSIWVFRLQMEIVLIYAGIVKINPDWLRLQPLAMWLAKHSHLPIIGAWVTHYWFIALAAYGSIFLHILGAPLLLIPRVRVLIFFIYVIFHILNTVFWHIGVFPWITIAATTLFFDPNWPKQFIAWIKSRFGKSIIQKSVKPTTYSKPITSSYYVVFGAFIIWFLFQILFPIRHLLYPGNVAWNEGGHRFSWRMKLRDKNAVLTYLIKDNQTGKSWYVHPRQYLTQRQWGPMKSRPDMILQFAHFLAKKWQEKGYKNVSIYAYSLVSLNGRPYAVFIDKNRDLTKVKRSLKSRNWVMPFKNTPVRPYWFNRESHK